MRTHAYKAFPWVYYMSKHVSNRIPSKILFSRGIARRAFAFAFRRRAVCDGGARPAGPLCGRAAPASARATRARARRHTARARRPPRPLLSPPLPPERRSSSRVNPLCPAPSPPAAMSVQGGFHNDWVRARARKLARALARALRSEKRGRAGGRARDAAASSSGGAEPRRLRCAPAARRRPGGLALRALPGRARRAAQRMAT